jgi:RloB-like protein
MAKGKKTEHGYSSRNVDVREPKQKFLIVCEGTKTEPNYFRSFRVPKDVMDIRGVGENPSRLVESAKRFSQEEEYDQVWCVFDRDSWTKEDFNNAISSAAKEGFRVAYSNEAFEIWYILHFEFLHTATSRQDYGKKLTALLDRKYEKNSKTIYDDLFTKQPTAIKNATNLLQQFERPNPDKDNPSTTVHLLVQELNRFL